MTDRSAINAAFNEAFKEAQELGGRSQFARLIGCYEAIILRLARDGDDERHVLESLQRFRERMREPV